MSEVDMYVEEYLGERGKPGSPGNRIIMSGKDNKGRQTYLLDTNPISALEFKKFLDRMKIYPTIDFTMVKKMERGKMMWKLTVINSKHAKFIARQIKMLYEPRDNY